jgi:hypothetical protein
MMPFSKPQLERIGTAFIAEQLYREGLKLAWPDIDEGIDLIVYSDDAKSFRAIPLQIKAFSREEFYTDQKYLRIPDLRIVYLWHVGTEQPIRAFGMPYREAEQIVDQRKWTRDKRGRCTRTSGTTTLTNAIIPFEIRSCWRDRLFN